MRRTSYLTATISLLFVSSASAQAPQFLWQAGQVLTYKVSQTTTAVETVGESKLETTTKLDLVKRWQVLAVDAAGTATLQMSIAMLRMETKPPTGDALLFDSANLAKSTEALRDELTKYLNVPVTVVRIDARGQLAEVKESKFGPASRLECDLPFKLTLPAQALAPNLAWERKYAIKLEPPQGAGETYDAVQKYACKGIANGAASIAVTTTVTNPPEAAADQIPLLPLQPAGEVVFDLTKGRLKSVQLQATKTLTGHRGEGSKYEFMSRYVEDVIDK